MEGLGKTSEAREALNAGLEASPHSTLLRNRLQELTSNSSTSSRPSASSSSTSSNNTWIGGALGDRLIDSVRYFMLACFVLYFIPFHGRAHLFYRAIVASGLVVHFALIAKECGPVEWNETVSVFFALE